jgi:two-component system cell cycle sensor histidine kinase/response regulator CckA
MKSLEGMSKEELIREVGNCRACLSSLIDEMDDAVYFKDLESRFVMCNQSMAQKHPVKGGEILGRKDTDIFTNEHAQQAFEDEQEIIKTGEPLKDIEEKETWPDGSVTWVSSSKMPLYDVDHKIVGTCGVSHDITSRKMSELRLNKAQKLESLGLLAGGIAHDFNNLITMVRCHIELALGELKDDSGAQKLLDDVYPVLDKAADLTEHLLMFAGRSPTKLTPVVISDVVRKTAKLMRGSVPYEVVIECVIDENVPAINCDVVQVEQTVMNLIRNAVEALSGDKGRIDVKLTTGEYGAEFFEDISSLHEMPSGTYISLEVQDDGCGMDEDTASKIFDPFFTTKQKGKGLGLASIMGMLNTHEAAVKVDSALDKGTTFILLFPAAVA